MLPEELMERLGKAVAFEGGVLGPLTRIIGQRVAYGDFTDGGGASATLALDEKIPAGSRYKFAVINTTTAFTADTTAVVTIGDGSDADRFSPATDDKSMYTTGVLTIDPADPADAGDGISEIEAETGITLTITGTGDWGDNVVAGEADVFIVYEHIPYLACE